MESIFRGTRCHSILICLEQGSIPRFGYILFVAIRGRSIAVELANRSGVNLDHSDVSDDSLFADLNLLWVRAVAELALDSNVRVGRKG